MPIGSSIRRSLSPSITVPPTCRPYEPLPGGLAKDQQEVVVGQCDVLQHRIDGPPAIRGPGGTGLPRPVEPHIDLGEDRRERVSDRQDGLPVRGIADPVRGLHGLCLISKFHTSDNSPPQTRHSNQQSLTTFHSLQHRQRRGRGGRQRCPMGLRPGHLPIVEPSGFLRDETSRSSDPEAGHSARRARTTGRRRCRSPQAARPATSG